MKNAPVEDRETTPDNIFAELVNSPNPTVEDFLKILKENSKDLSSESGKVEKWKWIHKSFIKAVTDHPNKFSLHRLYLKAVAEYSDEIT